MKTHLSEKWQRLGKVDPLNLIKARLELHQAAQLIAAIGSSYLEPREDAGHSNMEWLGDNQVFAGNKIGGKKKYRVALHPADLKLQFLDGSGKILSEFALEGRLLDGAIEWLREELTSYGFDKSKFNFPDNLKLPAAGQSQGQPFRIDMAAAFEEHAKYFSNADLILKEVLKEVAGASEVRCWPHHFDIASLITVDKRLGKSIGVGLSPGDDSYNEPYFYVTPWPYPDEKLVGSHDLSGGGFWHTKGWIGAVLQGSEIIKETSREAQVIKNLLFLESAINACFEILAS